jgi:hypothetical protein
LRKVKEKGERKMKKLISALIVALLLASTVAVFTPSAKAAIYNPALFVLPQEGIEFEGPCHVSEYFDISVKLTNQYEETLAKVYAFDFKLTWDKTLVKLINVTYDEKIQKFWPAGKYFVIVPPNVTAAQITGVIQFAVTALDNATFIDGKYELIDFIFHVEKEPCWPDNYHTDFTITDAKLSDNSTPPKNVPVDVFGTSYDYISWEPVMYLSPKNILKWTNATTFTVEVMLANATKVYDYEFYLYFNKLLLMTDPQMVHIKDTIPPPYELQIVEVCDSYVHVKVVRPCEKTGISFCTPAPIVNIDFKTYCPGDIPAWANSTLDLRDATISSKCPLTRIYHEVSVEEVGKGTVTPKTNVVSHGTYIAAGVELYVKDGTKDWAGIDIPVDIALKDITELKFDQIVTWWGANGWDVNVVLGIDLDGDGVFESDLPAWHQGATMHTTAVLKGDTFMEMDGGVMNPWPPAWKTVNALAAGAWPGVGQWWTPNASGNGLSINIWNDWPTTLSKIAAGGWDTNVPNTNVRVKMIKLLIGGSGSWMDETAFVKNLVFNGKCYAMWTWLNVYDGMYFFRPLNVDLNQDGHVDIVDLTAIAKVYGKSSPWAALVAPPGNVDLYDVVLVAKKFCKPYTPPIDDLPKDIVVDP